MNPTAGQPPSALPHSFEPDAAETIEGPTGQLGHRLSIDHTDRLTRRLWQPRPGVWSLVGNGLSNQNFVEGPEGLIVIDTGESQEEMASALAEVRAHTSAPIAAVIYTHFHYVSGTKALAIELGDDLDDLPVWGHAGIVDNLQRMSSEVSAAAGRGIVHQFGLLLDDDGPDGLINVGLGLSFRDRHHAPHTPGFSRPTHTISEPTQTTIAGLTVELIPAPSDADDSIHVWFPELSVCVNNIVWPALFNVFAIRGEEYRDPRILLTGLDSLLALRPDHLVGAHGPPLSGQEEIQREVVLCRDAIAFLWDQTVRGINRGLTLDELVQFVQLLDDYGRSYLTQQLYGVVEHHVRQIHAGLRGFFDGHDAALFPVPPLDRVAKLIAGFGGAESVRAEARAALDGDDLRWAVELASWLVRSEVDDYGRIDGGTPQDRALLAEGLRRIGQRTTSANVRNWCLTRARELEGSLDLARFRVHRFNRHEVAAGPPEVFVRALRVTLDPGRARGLDQELGFDIDGSLVGLHIRRGVAVPTDGTGAADGVRLDSATWASLLAGKVSLDEALAGGAVELWGTPERVVTALGCFDVAGLRLGSPEGA